ncbi:MULTISPECIES: hypothetical protein [Kitasatospora]|uniref:hypothetical protein n=1 Tax=Kitasatospora TaxID=2063 RepID=UPI000670AB10|nr:MULTISPECIES: hypothetical protein [Kitasatospora]
MTSRNPGDLEHFLRGVDAALRDLAIRARETKESSTGRPRHQPPTARPADRLPSPERSAAERMRDLLTPGGPH